MRSCDVKWFKRTPQGTMRWRSPLDRFEGLPHARRVGAELAGVCSNGPLTSVLAAIECLTALSRHRAALAGQRIDLLASAFEHLSLRGTAATKGGSHARFCCNRCTCDHHRNSRGRLLPGWLLQRCCL